MTSPFRCEDCDGPITGTVAENAALAAGVRLCIGCIESIEEDAEAYRRMDKEDGREPCTFFERNLAPASPAPVASPAQEV